MKSVPSTRVALACAVLTCLLVLATGAARAQSEQKIVVLVNDQPISAYDISQRLQFMALSTRQQPSAKLRKSVTEDLINEALMLQEAKKAGIAISPDRIMQSLDGIAKRNKSTGDKLLQAFAQRGVKSKTIKQRIEASMAWRRFVQQKFRGQVSIGASQIDKALSATEGGGVDKTEFQLRRVRLALPSNPDQRTIAARLTEAEHLRSGFKSCDSISNLLKRVRKASVRDIGRKRSDQMAQPVRAFLLKAKHSDVTPPSVTSAGVEFYAVCGRRTIKSNDTKRRQVKAQLRQQEYQIRARRHLRDLRQDAFIEYR